MKVFISWSGEQSHGLALALRRWARDLIQALDTWVSSEDIPKGASWAAEIRNALDGADVGIVCVTNDSQDATWLNFEAGAISTGVRKTCVVYLGMDATDLRPPLATLQATDATDREDMQKLARTLNSELTEPLGSDVLDRAFARCWDELAEEIRTIAGSRPANRRPARSDRELLEELLRETRILSQEIVRSATLDRRHETVVPLALLRRGLRPPPGAPVSHPRLGVGRVLEYLDEETGKSVLVSFSGNVKAFGIDPAAGPTPSVGETLSR